MPEVFCFIVFRPCILHGEFVAKWLRGFPLEAKASCHVDQSNDRRRRVAWVCFMLN